MIDGMSYEWCHPKINISDLIRRAEMADPVYRPTEEDALRNIADLKRVRYIMLTGGLPATMLKWWRWERAALVYRDKLGEIITHRDRLSFLRVADGYPLSPRFSEEAINRGLITLNSYLTAYPTEQPPPLPAWPTIDRVYRKWLQNKEAL